MNGLSIYYLDAGIVNSVGHNLETVVHLREAFECRGDFKVLGGASFEGSDRVEGVEAVLPYGSPHWPKRSFLFKCWSKLFRLSGIPFFQWLSNYAKDIETHRALASQHLQSGSIFVINSVELDDALCQAKALLRLVPDAKIKVILHYSPFERDSTLLRPHIARSLRQLGMLKRGAVDFFADTTTLCAVYSALLDCEVQLIPIPHLRDEANSLETDERVPVTYFGVYSEVKSPHLLSTIIPMCQSECQNAWQVKITFLARNHVSNAFAQHMRQLSECVDYKEGPFSPQEVSEILSRGGIVLLPYHSHDYEIQSSGVVMEAISSGCVPLVSASMHDAAALERIDPVFVGRPNNAKDFAERIIEVSKNYSFYKQKLNSLREEIVAFNNPHNFVRTLLGSE